MDYNQISALATVVTAIVAIIGTWLQGRWTRRAVLSQMAWELEKSFYHEPRMVLNRRRAAEGLLSGRLTTDLIEVGNLIDSAGAFLRKGIIDDDMAASTFYRRAACYWYCGGEPLQQMLRDNPGMWTDWKDLLVQVRRAILRRPSHFGLPVSTEAKDWMALLRLEASLGTGDAITSSGEVPAVEAMSMPPEGGSQPASGSRQENTGADGSRPSMDSIR